MSPQAKSQPIRPGREPRVFAGRNANKCANGAEETRVNEFVDNRTASAINSGKPVRSAWRSLSTTVRSAVRRQIEPFSAAHGLPLLVFSPFF
jgi:hypothetical protein